jgi:hypothetical protein
METSTDGIDLSARSKLQLRLTILLDIHLRNWQEECNRAWRGHSIHVSLISNGADVSKADSR